MANADAPDPETTPASDIVGPEGTLGDADVPALPSPESLPGGRPSLVFYLAVIINRLLWLLRKFPKLLPTKYKPYIPLAAAALGLAYGILEAGLYGTPWLTAILTGIAGAGGAVFWREGTRSLETYKKRKNGDPGNPPPPAVLTDDDLAGAAS